MVQNKNNKTSLNKQVLAVKRGIKTICFAFQSAFFVQNHAAFTNSAC